MPTMISAEWFRGPFVADPYSRQASMSRGWIAKRRKNQKIMLSLRPARSVDYHFCILTNTSSIMALSSGWFDPSSVLLVGSIETPDSGPFPSPSPRNSPGLVPLSPASRPMGCSGSVQGNLGIETRLTSAFPTTTSSAHCSRVGPYSQGIPDLTARAVIIPSM